MIGISEYSATNAWNYNSNGNMNNNNKNNSNNVRAATEYQMKWLSLKTYLQRIMIAEKTNETQRTRWILKLVLSINAWSYGSRLMTGLIIR